VTGPQEPRSAAAGHPTPEELSEFAFSPEAASAALHGHVRDCPSCGAEAAELQTLVASLAQLPEPALPESVGIRLDAAFARAWQEADAEQEAAAGSTGNMRARTPAERRTRSRWRRLVVPLGVVCLIVVAAIGVGRLLTSGRSGVSAAGPAAPANSPASGDAALTAWVHSVLPTAATGAATGPGVVPQIGHGTESRTFAGRECPNAPAAPAGYTLLTSSQRDFEGKPATLVVYQNAQEPASRPLFAVVYAGSCPTVSSAVLDQGLVSR
jgi:hypothetical protein